MWRLIAKKLIKISKGVILTAVLFLTGICNAKEDEAQTLTFRGNLVYTNHFVTNAPGKTLYFSFQRKSCAWLLKSGVTARELGYTETGFDGTNQFRYTYWNSEPLEKARSDKTKAYFVTGQVAPHQMPDFDAAWSRHIWFALMPYSCGPMTTINPCDLVTGSKSLTNCNRMLFPTSETPGSYLSKAIVWSQGNDVLEDGSVVPLGSPFDQGFTNMLFSSSIIEGVDGLKYPSHFEYHVYGAIGKSPTLLWSLYGTITNVTSDSEFNPIPEVVDPTYIIDFRATNFGRRQVVNYLITNRWLDPIDAKFKKLTSIGDEAVISGRHAAAVKWFIVGFAAVGLLLNFIIWQKRK